MPYIHDVQQNGAPVNSLPVEIGTEFLEKYKIERVLGRGGMGVVIAARHKTLRQLVAIKFLVPEVASNRDAVTRFLREARAAAAIRSEHVVSVYDVDQLADGQPFMIMEYIEGRDLKSIVHDNPLPVDHMITYVLQVCEAVREAHQAGIVHRDLKPANLMLTKRANGSPCVKVLDFGIAKMADPDQTSTTGKCIMGSLKYMSPEQLFTPHLVDGRADIWALGIVAYELLTGTTPFVGYTEIDIVTNINHAVPRPPSKLRPEVPPAVDALILTCLHKNSADRYQSVDELMEALRNARTDSHATPATVRSPSAVPEPPLPLPPPPPSSVAPLPAVPPDDDKLRHGFGLTNQLVAPRTRPSWVAITSAAVATIAAGGTFYFMLGQSPSQSTNVAASALPSASGAPTTSPKPVASDIHIEMPGPSSLAAPPSVAPYARQGAKPVQPTAPAPTITSSSKASPPIQTSTVAPAPPTAASRSSGRTLY